MMPYRDKGDDAVVAAMVQSTIRGANHALAGWIIGITIGIIPLAIGVVLLVDDLMTPKGSVFYKPGPPWFAITFLVAAALVAPITILIVRAMNSAIEARVRRMLREGRRFEGRIVQARRVSMSQSRVIVQGIGFMPCESLLSTSLPDAVLFGRIVDVYVHPSEPHAPLVIPPPER